MMKNFLSLIADLQGCKFASLTYCAKNSGEIARYTLCMGASYLKACKRDILECEIRMQTADGVMVTALGETIASLNESLNAAAEDRFHKAYTKAGLYTPICKGIQLSKNDNTLEIMGFQSARKVLVPGVHKIVKHKSELTAMKASIRRSLITGKFRTLCLDNGNALLASVSGTKIIFPE